jgi:hypothetical protein
MSITECLGDTTPLCAQHRGKRQGSFLTASVLRGVRDSRFAIRGSQFEARGWRLAAGGWRLATQDSTILDSDE